MKNEKSRHSQGPLLLPSLATDSGSSSLSSLSTPIAASSASRALTARDIRFAPTRRRTCLSTTASVSLDLDDRQSSGSSLSSLPTSISIAAISATRFLTARDIGIGIGLVPARLRTHRSTGAPFSLNLDDRQSSGSSDTVTPSSPSSASTGASSAGASAGSELVRASTGARAGRIVPERVRVVVAVVISGADTLFADICA